MLGPRGTCTPALQARGWGKEQERSALHISEATAFAFKAEILLSEQSQQLQLGPDKEALRGLSSLRQSKEEPDLAGGRGSNHIGCSGPLAFVLFRIKLQCFGKYTLSTASLRCTWEGGSC